MERHSLSKIAYLSIILTTIATIGTALALDPPDSDLNTTSGNIETTDSIYQQNNYDVRHVVDPGDGGAVNVVMLTTCSEDDVGPRLTISSGGDTWITWYRDKQTDEVRLKKHTYSTGTWSTEELVSDVNDSSRNPEIIHDGSNPWIVWEVEDDLGDTEISVRAIFDDPQPYGSIQKIRTTPFTGDVDVDIHYDSGHLWITWVDSSSDLGWSEYDYSEEEWGSAEYESYSSESVEEARRAVREVILGQN